MKKLYLIMVGILCLILMTGCESLFEQIPKDTVMVKKIAKADLSSELEYEGTLSQDAIKTLSLNAVNKYFDENIKVEQLQYELTVIEQNGFKELLSEAESDITRGPMIVDPHIKMIDEADLESISSGLYFATLAKSTTPDEIYEIVLNAKDGKIIKVFKKEITRVVQDISEENSARIIEIANQFIEAKGSYQLTDLKLNKELTRWADVAELYYTSKEGNDLKYCVMVDMKSEKIVGFSKDVMALVSFYTSR